MTLRSRIIAAILGLLLVAPAGSVLAADSSIAPMNAAKATKLDIYLASGGRSPNQIQQAIRRGQVPDGIVALHTPKIPGEQIHFHFKNGAALNKDGTWKHGFTKLTIDQKGLLKLEGWKIPGEN